MASKGLMTGMRGVYLVAAELVGFGYIVSPTSRSMLAADLLVTDQRCRRAYSVQVKTNGKPGHFWLLGKHAKGIKSDDHIYVFVNLRDAEDEPPDFYVVPSTIVARKLRYTKHRTGSEWWSMRLDDAAQYENAWMESFGRPF